MLEYAVALAASFFAAKALLRLRPKRSSALIFLPVLLIASFLAIVLLYMTVSSGSGGYIPITSPFGPSFVGSVFGAVYMWRGGKQAEEERARMSVLRAVQISDRENSAEGMLDSRPRAKIAIRHRDDVGTCWNAVQSIGGRWPKMFLDRLESDPKADPIKIADGIGAELGEVYPYGNAATGAAYDRLPDDESARSEFRRTMSILGDSTSPDAVADRISGLG